MNSYTVAGAKEEIKSSIEVYLSKDKKGEYIMNEVNKLPFFLIGAPGVGKTEMAKQIADELGIGFVSLSITHHTRNTVLGLPVIEDVGGNSREKCTVYTMSEIVSMVQSKVNEGYEEGILLVDEFASMADSLVAPMLAFLQTKNIGNYRLPKGWTLILCSNPTEYNRTARKFDMAVMDRVREMNIRFDTKEFIEYGKSIDIHPAIIQYLDMYPFDAQVCERVDSQGSDNYEQMVIVTPRGWENLSHCIKGYESLGKEISTELIRQFIKSETIAKRFSMYYQSICSGIDLNDLNEILDGKNLSRHINKVKAANFKTRFQVMEIILNRITEETKKYGINYQANNNTDCTDKDADLRSGEKLSYKIAKEISQRISNACIFIDSVQSDDDLMPIFISKLNECPGALNVLRHINNPEYLKYARKICGIDSYLKRAAGM